MHEDIEFSRLLDAVRDLPKWRAEKALAAEGVAVEPGNGGPPALIFKTKAGLVRWTPNRAGIAALLGELGRQIYADMAG
jgi:hypothetical protein